MFLIVCKEYVKHRMMYIIRIQRMLTNIKLQKQKIDTSHTTCFEHIQKNRFTEHNTNNWIVMSYFAWYKYYNDYILQIAHNICAKHCTSISASTPFSLTINRQIRYDPSNTINNYYFKQRVSINNICMQYNVGMCIP